MEAPLRVVSDAHAPEDAKLPPVCQLVDACLDALPPKPRQKCDREHILRGLEQLGCATDPARLKLEIENSLLHEKKRAALKEAIGCTKGRCALIFLAKLTTMIGAYKPPVELLPSEAANIPGLQQLITQSLPQDAMVTLEMRMTCLGAGNSFAVGLRGGERRPSPSLVRGRAPSRENLCQMAALYSREHALYPAAFLENINLQQIILCEQLTFDFEAWRDVPDMLRGVLYIDAADLHFRRSRHCFHHELWHMADLKLRGARFDQPDPAWEQFNPPGFRYGGNVDGTHMRDGVVSELSSVRPSKAYP